jgi:hypothetical protein
MLAKQARAIVAGICEEFGVSELELRHGTRLKTTGGRYPAQLTVSLARYTLVWRMWRAGADIVETGIYVAITPRRVRSWYRDFSTRQANADTARLRARRVA